MYYVYLLEIAAVAAVLVALLGLHKKHRMNVHQERLTAAFERAQAQRTNGSGLQGNALIDPNF